jgi:opacity protein-like surface antigen
MKKIILTAFIIIIGAGCLHAQKKVTGIVAGYNSFVDKIKGVRDGTVSESGFYIGLFKDFEVSNELSLRTELQYVRTNTNHAIDQLVLPIMLNYGVGEKMIVSVGVVADYILDLKKGLDSFGFAIGIGAAHDIGESLFISTKYSFGLTNRIDNAPRGVSEKLGGFQVGLGYKF